MKNDLKEPVSHITSIGDQMMEKQEEKSSSFLKILGIGCLGFIILGALGAWYVVNNVKSITAEVAQSIAGEIINKTQLPEEDKKELLVILDEITEDVKDGKITNDEFRAMLESFSESGLLPALGLRFFETAYLKDADLSQEKKEELLKHLSRYRWGLINDKIEYFNQNLDDIMNIISVKQGDKSEFKQELTNDELLDAVNIMKEAADISQIEDKKFNIEVAKEVRKVLDRAKEKALEQEPSENK